MRSDLPAHETYLRFADTLADVSRAMLCGVADQRPDVELKADASYVTATDKAVEAALRDRIAERFPDHGILGEEWGRENLGAEFVWVLDPIDGTAPFIAGLPVYGTLIGLAWGGRPYLGIIDLPATAMRFAGVSGRFATRDGAPVRVRHCGALAPAFVTCSSPDFMAPADQVRFAEIRRLAQYVQYGGSCHAYAMLASGRTDLAVDGGLDPVDVYACAAVIEGAGGIMTDWTGAPLSFDMTGTVLAAGDKACLDEAITHLAG
mgnify:CR=1 FL=1